MTPQQAPSRAQDEVEEAEEEESEEEEDVEALWGKPALAPQRALQDETDEEVAESEDEGGGSDIFSRPVSRPAPGNATPLLIMVLSRGLGVVCAVPNQAGAGHRQGRRRGRQARSRGPGKSLPVKGAEEVTRLMPLTSRWKSRCSFTRIGTTPPPANVEEGSFQLCHRV